MKNKATITLVACTVLIFAIIGVGFISSTSKEEVQPTTSQPTQPKETSLSRSDLDAQLTAELPVIKSVLLAAFPSLEQTYTIERSALYGNGEWYGGTLQYIGPDTNNRDTLRVVLQKKNNIWTLRTPQPQILVSSVDIRDAPATMLDEVNKPAPLSGTPTSPAIIPGE